MALEIMQRLGKRSEALGLPLRGEQVDALGRLLTSLLQWNQKINLTSITDPDEIIEKHFLDSLAAAAAIPAGPRRVVDVGSGPGFPGLLIAFARPDVKVTTVESIHKKVAFTRQAARDLGLANLTARAERLEQIVAGPDRFDVAVSRATFEPSEWLGRALPLLAPSPLGPAEVHAMTVAAAPALAPPPELSLDRVVDYVVDGVPRQVRCFVRGDR